MKLVKQLISVGVCLCIIIGLSSCMMKTEVSSSSLPFDKKIGAMKTVGVTTVSKGEYRLDWDDELKAVSLTDTAQGLTWSTTPNSSAEPKYDELGMPVKIHPQVNSAIWVEYIDSSTESVVTINSYNASVKNGYVTCEALSDGFEVTYYFSNEEIAIPLQYRLSDSGLSISLQTKKIQENKNKVYRISLVPFLCSVANNATDSYLFIPSGSGALVYPKEISGMGVSYSQEMYGKDPAVETWESSANEQAVRLPVFGSKTGNKAMCGIIKKGAELAIIEVVNGSTSFGYAAVYATFQVRGYSDIRTNLYTGWISQSPLYSEALVDSEITVTYDPLIGEQASYSGMAKSYQNYLVESGLMHKSNRQSDLNLIFYGGIMAKKSFLGISYDSLYAATTFNQVKETLKEIKEKTGVSPDVKLKGFGSSGLDVGSSSDSYTFNKKIGSAKHFTALSDYCKDQKISLFFDIDLIRRPGRSWFSGFDAVKGLNNQTIYQYNYYVSSRDRTDDSRYVLTSRTSLNSGVGTVLKKLTSKNITGVSLDTLGSIAYSDYCNQETFVKCNMQEDVLDIMKQIYKTERQVAVSDANSYAAAQADVIFETPLQSTKDIIFDVDVPFYQMVFRGYKSISSSIVNLAKNQEDSILRAIESGCALTFSLYNTYNTSLLGSKYPVFNSGTSSDLKEMIISKTNELHEYYDAIKDTKINQHNIIEPGFTETVFENGTSVFVNRTEKNQTVNGGEVLPYSYKIVEEQK